MGSGASKKKPGTAPSGPTIGTPPGPTVPAVAAPASAAAVTVTSHAMQPKPERTDVSEKEKRAVSIEPMSAATERSSQSMALVTAGDSTDAKFDGSGRLMLVSAGGSDVALGLADRSADVSQRATKTELQDASDPPTATVVRSDGLGEDASSRDVRGASASVPAMDTVSAVTAAAERRPAAEPSNFASAPVTASAALTLDTTQSEPPSGRRSALLPRSSPRMHPASVAFAARAFALAQQAQEFTAVATAPSRLPPSDAVMTAPTPAAVGAFFDPLPASAASRTAGTAPHASSTSPRRRMDYAAVLAEERPGAAASAPIHALLGAPADARPAVAVSPAVAYRCAVRAQDVTTVRALLERGDLRVNAPFEDGDYPIHVAAQHGTEALEALLAAGADAAVRDREGNTALHAAVRLGNAAAVVTLLAHGADLHARNRKGNTPLHVAAMWRNAELYDLLLQRGADATTLLNEDRRTAHELMHGVTSGAAAGGWLVGPVAAVASAPALRSPIAGTAAGGRSRSPGSTAPADTAAGSAASVPAGKPPPAMAVTPRIAPVPVHELRLTGTAASRALAGMVLASTPVDPRTGHAGSPPATPSTPTAAPATATALPIAAQLQAQLQQRQQAQAVAAPAAMESFVQDYLNAMTLRRPSSVAASAPATPAPPDSESAEPSEAARSLSPQMRWALLALPPMTPAAADEVGVALARAAVSGEAMRRTQGRVRTGFESSFLDEVREFVVDDDDSGSGGGGATAAVTVGTGAMASELRIQQQQQQLAAVQQRQTASRSVPLPPTPLPDEARTVFDMIDETEEAMARLAESHVAAQRARPVSVPVHPFREEFSASRIGRTAADASALDPRRVLELSAAHQVLRTGRSPSEVVLRALASDGAAPAVASTAVTATAPAPAPATATATATATQAAAASAAAAAAAAAVARFGTPRSGTMVSMRTVSPPALAAAAPARTGTPSGAHTPSGRASAVLSEPRAAVALHQRTVAATPARDDTLLHWVDEELDRMAHTLLASKARTVP